MSAVRTADNTTDITASGGGAADISDIVIIGFGELSGLIGRYTFGGPGTGAIVCRVLFVHPGCGIKVVVPRQEGGEELVADCDGGEHGTLVFFPPRPDSPCEIVTEDAVLSPSRLLYIDYLTPSPFTGESAVYTQTLRSHGDLTSYVNLIEALMFRYYTEGETEDILRGCREAAAAFVNYAPRSAGVPHVTDERVIKAMRSVRADLRDITRAEAARAAGVSSVYIGELFEKTIGISIGRYIREYRLCAAQMLIRQGMTVDEAAKIVGYNGGSSFARARKRFRPGDLADPPEDLAAGLTEDDSLK
ncbi:MAG: AraC family transcriptional regulator [Clostridiales bacterium]|nr:AraC family transcriptional regulator [Clostridiales bacterium]